MSSHWSAFNTHRTLRSALGVLLLVLLSSCATTRAEKAWRLYLLEADRDVDHRRFARARALYLRLRPNAPSHARRRYIDYQLARILAETGDTEQAWDAFQTLIDTPNPDDDPYDSRALFQQAELCASARHDHACAWAMRKDLVRRFPEASITPRTLRMILDHHRNTDTLREAQRFLAELYVRHADTDFGDHILYTAIRLYLDDLHDPERAYELLLIHRNAYPFSPFRDDALMLLGQLAEERGQPDQALIFFERLAEIHETPWGLGSYNPSKRTDAFVAKAELLTRMGRTRDAIDQYQRLLTQFPQVRWRTRIARTRLELFRDPLNDRTGYINALLDFFDTYPDSIYNELLRIRFLAAISGAPLNHIPAIERTYRDVLGHLRHTPLHAWLDPDAP